MREYKVLVFDSVEPAKLRTLSLPTIDATSWPSFVCLGEKTAENTTVFVIDSVEPAKLPALSPSTDQRDKLDIILLSLKKLLGFGTQHLL